MTSPFEWQEIGKESKDYKVVIGKPNKDDDEPSYLLVNKTYGVVEADCSLLPEILSIMNQAQAFLDQLDKDSDKVKPLLHILNKDKH